MGEVNLPIESIESKIHVVRGIRVMLDSDLALLYGVDTKILNQTVRRNIERFPADFMFQLSENEWENLKSQIVTSSLGHGGRRKLPLVFSEYGVAMLSSVLKSEQAIQVNIAIMRIFGKLRRILASNVELAKKLAELESKYDRQFKVVFDAIRELVASPPIPRKRIVGLGK
ncbi:MAG: ORF6N domain-containing protein [Deltaproteobacteria bacterium]|nr:ORF6N domain-containing protein [Deltaproteobacteria bacterium]